MLSSSLFSLSQAQNRSVDISLTLTSFRWSSASSFIYSLHSVRTALYFKALLLLRGAMCSKSFGSHPQERQSQGAQTLDTGSILS